MKYNQKIHRTQKAAPVILSVEQTATRGEGQKLQSSIAETVPSIEKKFNQPFKSDIFCPKNCKKHHLPVNSSFDHGQFLGQPIPLD